MEGEDKHVFKCFEDFGKRIGVSVFVDEIPAELKQHKNWVLWKEIEGRKVPFSFSDGKLKAINARDTHFHLTFDDAVKSLYSIYGLMFVIEGTDYWVIDFDDFSNVEEVKEIVSKSGSYAEMTPSGQGFRIWFKGHNPFTSKDKTFKLSDGRLIEVFNNKQVTVTGRRISEEREIRAVHEDFVLYLREKYIGKYEEKGELGQEETIDKRASRVLSELMKRYNGVRRNGYVSLSCPLHQPDTRHSSEIYLNEGTLNSMTFVCHHENKTLSLRELLKRINLSWLLYDDGPEDGSENLALFSKEIKGPVDVLLKIYEDKDFYYYAVRLQTGEVIFVRAKTKYHTGQVEMMLEARDWSKDVLKTAENSALHLIFKTIGEYLKEEWGLKLKTEFVMKIDDGFKDALVDFLYELKQFQKSREFPLFYDERDAELGVIDKKEYELIKAYGFFRGGAYDEIITQIWPMYWYNLEFVPYLANYAPHSIIVTNTKSGKTSLAMNFMIRSFTDVVADGKNITLAGILGFSTGNETHEGMLSNIQGVVFVDEIQDSDKQAAQGLLTLLEHGFSYVVKGKSSLFTRYSNSFVFMSNRKLEENLEMGFLQLLNLINENAEALGSRIGVVLFKDRLAEARNDPRYANLKKQEEYFYKALALRKRVSKWFVDLFQVQEIRDWLETGFSEDYLKKLDELVASASTLKVKTFIKSHKSAYKHVRGAALRLALYDDNLLLRYLNNEKVPTEEILEVAEEKFNYLTQLNLESFIKVSTIFADEKIINEYVHINASNSAFKVLLVSIKAYTDYKKEKEFNTKNKRESDFVRFYNECVKQHVPISRYASRYTLLEERVTIPSCVGELGLQIVKDEDGIYVRVVDEVLWSGAGWLDKVKIADIYAREMYDKIMREVNRAEIGAAPKEEETHLVLKRALRTLLAELRERYGDRLLPLDVLKKTMEDFPGDLVMSELSLLQEKGYVVLFEQDNAFIIVRRPEVVE
ncbi:MAG: hypothetical protein QW051_00595 [Candidatus Aenigmatarchaeota archaeon]